MIPWLDRQDPFPSPEQALRDPNGLLAAGADLSPERLLDAYAQGIFPWFGEDDPVLWWSPDPRMVLVPSEVHVSRSLRRVMQSGRFRVTADRAFREVMEGCAAPRSYEPGTWITGEMMEAYGQLAALGFAHSVEVWEDGALAGGLYGVAIGRMFFGESMFSRRSNASKVALAYAARHLERWGFAPIDCQMSTPHLASMGASEIARRDFLGHVRNAIRRAPPVSPWVFDADLMKRV